MIHMLVGIQGSGKSTYALELSKELNCEIVSTDNVRKAGVPEQDVWKVVYQKCADALNNNIDVIYDATNITPKVRKRLFDEVSKLEATPVVGAYFFDTDVKTCFERVKKRNTIEGELFLPEEVVFSYHSKLIKPECEEGFEFVKTIKDGKVVEVKYNEKKYNN